MKKKLLISILFILLLLSSITIVSASNTTANCTGKDSDTGIYTFETSDNETLSGVCLDYDRSEPSSQENENVTYTLNNTSIVDNKIKEAIVKYYRNESNLTLDELQNLIWKIQGRNINDTSNINAMYDSLTGTMEIGDTYTYNDGTSLYTFKFYYALPSNEGGPKAAQRMLLFTYSQQPIPNVTIDNPTPETDNSTTNNVTTPELDKTEINNQTSNNSVDTNKVSATMKTTGIPINLILIILLSLLGLLIGRKQ